LFISDQICQISGRSTTLIKQVKDAWEDEELQGSCAAKPKRGAPVKIEQKVFDSYMEKKRKFCKANFISLNHAMIVDDLNKMVDEGKLHHGKLKKDKDGRNYTVRKLLEDGGWNKMNYTDTPEYSISI
jgi:hypothetical protein